MTDLDLDRIRARCEAATPGPWTTDGNTLYLPGPYPGGKAEQNVDWFAFPGNIATAEFIAHARTDVPALLAEVDRLRSKVAIARRDAFAEAAQIVDERAARDVGMASIALRLAADAIRARGEQG